MTSATRAALLIGVAATACLPSIALAQANPSEAGGIDDIIVTAQKRSERVQDVPIAISAFDDKALARQKLDSAIDLQIQTPNLLVVGNDRPTIRGIATTAPGADNATGVLLNFAPIGIRQKLKLQVCLSNNELITFFWADSVSEKRTSAPISLKQPPKPIMVCRRSGVTVRSSCLTVAAASCLVCH